MLSVVQRFGGKPVRCCLDTPTPATTTTINPSDDHQQQQQQQQQQPSSSGSSSGSSTKPAYLWDFARMREGPVVGAPKHRSGLTAVAVSSIELQPLPAKATAAAAATPSTRGQDEAALLSADATTALALAAVPMTETETEIDDDDEGEDGPWAGCHAPLYLEERRFRFSRAPLRHLQLAGALGLCNLVGAMWLLDQWRLFPEPPALALALFLGGRALAAYAWAFVLLPLLRLALIARWNRRRARRNALRRFLLDDFKARAADGASALHRKLELASRYRAHVMAGGGRALAGF